MFSALMATVFLVNSGEPSSQPASSKMIPIALALNQSIAPSVAQKFAVPEDELAQTLDSELPPQSLNPVGLQAVIPLNVGKLETQSYTPMQQNLAQSPLIPEESLPDLSPELEPPLPEPQAIPDPEDLLPIPDPPNLIEPVPEIEAPDTFAVNQFSFVGNTALSDEMLQAIVTQYTGDAVTLNDLFAARTAITQAYLDAGYINSGAYLPTQRIDENGIVEIRIIEGRLEAINIEGLGRLNPNYIRSRIALKTAPPLNVERLVEALQLLQLDPLLEELGAELSTGTETGASVLNLTVKEADAVDGLAILDNARSPLVGTFRRRAVFAHNNFLGQGDSLTLGYSNTDGSDSWDVAYRYPFNPRNGTLEFSYAGSRSEVIEAGADALNIESSSDQLEFGIRQPIYQTPREEFVLGLAVSYEESGSTFQLEDFDREPFINRGSDTDGKTRVTALRFRQEWTRRSAGQVMALRSQFSLGTDWFGATMNEGDIPDSNFLSWQGQAQYVKVFQNDIQLLMRMNGQWADRELLSTERFRLGGQGSVRGYRQDQVLTDNGLFASIEARFPVLTIPESEGSMQLATFIDYGLGWNDMGGDAEELLSVGIGTIWQFGDRVNARLDYGIPLIDPGSEGNTWQEQGILFTLTAEVF